MNTPVPYHLSAAEGHLLALRERALVTLAQTIRARGWTQARAAKHLGVTQPRISDLMRGKDGKFSLDTLVAMLAAMNLTVTLEVRETGGPGLGNRVWETSDSGAAIEHYNRVLELEPDSTLAFGRRAQTYWSRGDFEMAIADYDRAIELEPQRPGFRSNRALLYAKLGQLERALAEWDAMAEQFPDYDNDSGRALTLRALGRQEEALECLNRAIARDSSRPGPYWNRAVLLEGLGRLQDSLQDCLAVLERDPVYAAARDKADSLRARLK